MKTTPIATLYTLLVALLFLPCSLTSTPSFAGTPSLAGTPLFAGTPLSSVTSTPTEGFLWIAPESALPILVDANEEKGILRAIGHLQADANELTGVTPPIVTTITTKRLVVIGSIKSSCFIKELLKTGKLEASELQGKREKFLIQTIQHPFEGVEEALVIAGSDKRGTIYGIYELTTQMGVSPWYFWG